MSERNFILAKPDSVPWLSVAQMIEVDRLMIEELGITLARMMENAGRNLALVARRLVGGSARGRSIVVLCGPGGNGGGGLVAARHLAAAGANVEVKLSAAAAKLAPVPAEQLMILTRMGVAIEHAAAELGPQADLVVDALLGYSLRGTPRGTAAELIEAVAGRRVLALDVPSGLELSTGTLHDPHIEAEATMTLALPKEGLRAPGAAAAVGRLLLADISVPPALYERMGIRYQTPFGAAPLVELGG